GVDDEDLGAETGGEVDLPFDAGFVLVVADVAAVVGLDELVLARKLRRQDRRPDVPVQRLDAAVEVEGHVAGVDRWRLDRLARREDAQGRVSGVRSDLEGDADVGDRRRAAVGAAEVALLDRDLEAPIAAPGELTDEDLTVGLVAEPEPGPPVPG